MFHPHELAKSYNVDKYDQEPPISLIKHEYPQYNKFCPMIFLDFYTKITACHLYKLKIQWMAGICFLKYKKYR